MTKDTYTKKDLLWKELLGFGVYAVVGILIGLLLVLFVVQNNTVNGESMEPTLYPKDIVLVDKISRHFRDLERGDVVVVKKEYLTEYEMETDIIKRVVGLPGEKVMISQGEVYIDGRLLEESNYLNIGEQTYPEMEVELNEDEYFCMGDNRQNSTDSRTVGVIPKEQIKGRAILRIFPIDKFGTLK